MRLPALLLALTACTTDAMPALGQRVDLILRDVRPARLDLAVPQRQMVTVTGSNLCANPRVTVNGIAVEDAASDGETLRFDATPLVAPLAASADLRCDVVLPLQLTVDCTGDVPQAIYRMTYAEASRTIAWEAGLFGRVATTLHAATEPTSRRAGVLLEIGGELPPGPAEASIETGGVSAVVLISRKVSGSETTSFLGVYPKEPLAPGQRWTIGLRAGLDALHAKTRCLDFDGTREVTITARDTASTGYETNLRFENGVFVADVDEVGASEYRLRARTGPSGGVGNIASLVASSRTPHLAWGGYTAGQQTCLSVEVVGVPGLGKTEEQCFVP